MGEGPHRARSPAEGAARHTAATAASTERQSAADPLAHDAFEGQAHGRRTREDAVAAVAAIGAARDTGRYQRSLASPAHRQARYRGGADRHQRAAAAAALPTSDR